MKQTGTLVLTLTFLGLVGCSWRAEPLKSQPVAHTESLKINEQSEANILLYSFQDLRGGEFGYIYPTTFIPVLNFFHIGHYNKYPEQSGILKGNRGGRPVVSVGALDRALPYLISTMMREMRLTTSAVPMDSLNLKADLESFDYVVMGAVRKTLFKQHSNLIPLGILGLIGMPYVFTSYHMEYEVLLFRKQDMENPILKKTYTFDDHTAVGLYYNHSAAYDMFIASLEDSLPAVVKDIAEAIK